MGGPANAAALSGVADEYLIWSVEGKPVSVHLRLSAAGQIRTAAENAHDVAGILWGRVREAGEGHYLVAVEHAEVCSQGIARRLKQTAGSELLPVGYWRSRQDSSLLLDKQDIDRVTGLFAHPWCVAMSVKPPATAALFFWKDGVFDTGYSSHLFGLPAADLAPAEPASAAPSPRRRVKRWVAAAALVGALAAIPFVIGTRKQDNPHNQFAMQAETEAGLIRLRWNRESRALAGAHGAVVWIADGPEESKLELTAAQIRSGVFEYTPTHRDVNFRMVVGSLTESLRVPNAIPRVETANETEATEKPAAPEPRKASASRPPERSTVTATVEGVPRSRLKRAFGWIVPGDGKKGYIAPMPVRQVRPNVNARQTTSVAVRVRIDQRGAVRNAELLARNVDPEAGRAAIAAARRWRFQPARLQNRPVESEVVVRFHFAGRR